MLRANFTTSILIFAATIEFIACQEEFSPKGQFQNVPVVYSILIARADTQFVRVYTAYNPSGFDPLSVTSDNPVTNAQVAVNGGGQTFQLRDTIIQRTDKSRYSSDIHTYVGNPMRISPRTSYALNVTSSTVGNASSRVVVPDAGLTTITNSPVLDDPCRYRNVDINVFVNISAVTRGYLLRFLVEYGYVQNADTIVAREEVPVSVQVVGDRFVPTLASLIRRTSTTQNKETVNFSNELYRYKLQQILNNHPGTIVIFKTAHFILTQVEPNFYTYYNIVNGFQDQYSIRTDEPDYTNISGGVGVFGAIAIDTTSYVLPSDLASKVSCH